MTETRDREPTALEQLCMAIAYSAVFAVIAVYGLRILHLAISAVPRITVADTAGPIGLQFIMCRQTLSTSDSCETVTSRVRRDAVITLVISDAD